MTRKTLTLLALLAATAAVAQTEREQNEIIDSLYIEEVEERRGPDKVLHAEPLYIDLIRDLGARRGEKEWNVGLGLTDNNRYDRYTALVEYEWAPIDRLGLEVELPFSLFYPTENGGSAPSNRLNSLKLAAQYTFLVSERRKTSLALGYIHEFELVEFDRYASERILEGHLFNPFLVAAKRWGNNFHTLLYTGPAITLHRDGRWHSAWQANSNIHYMIPGTRNFIGIEFNKSYDNGDFDMTIRPQMRVGLADNLLVGIVAGIPRSRENERFSTFLRFIYEPGHRKGNH